MTFKERIQQLKDRARVASFAKDLHAGGQLELLSRAKYWATHPKQAQSYADMDCNWVLLPSVVVEDLPQIINSLRTDPHQSYLEKTVEQVGRFGVVGLSVMQGAANVAQAVISKPEEIQLAIQNRDLLGILENKQLMSMIENKWAQDHWKAHPDEYRDFGSKNKCEWVLLPRDLEQQVYDFIDPTNMPVRQKRRQAKQRSVQVNNHYTQAFHFLNEGLNSLHEIRKSKVGQSTKQVYLDLEPSGADKAKIDTAISNFKSELTLAAQEGVEIAKIDLAIYALGEDPYNIIGAFYSSSLSEEDKEAHRTVLKEISENSTDPLCKQRARVALSMDNIKTHKALYDLSVVPDLRTLARVSRVGGDIATKLWANNFCNAILNDAQYSEYKQTMTTYLNQEMELANQATDLKHKLYKTGIHVSKPSWIRSIFNRFLLWFAPKDKAGIVEAQVAHDLNILQNSLAPESEKEQAREDIKNLQEAAALEVNRAYEERVAQKIPEGLEENQVLAQEQVRREEQQIERFLATQLPILHTKEGNILSRMLVAGQEEEDFTDKVYANSEKTPMAMLEEQLGFREENLKAAENKVKEKQSILDNLKDPQNSIGGYISSWLWKPKPATEMEIQQAQARLEAAENRCTLCKESYESLLEIYQNREDNPNRFSGSSLGID